MCNDNDTINSYDNNLNEMIRFSGSFGSEHRWKFTYTKAYERTAHRI